MLPTRRACEGRSYPVVPQRLVWCCSTTAQLRRVGAVGLGWEKPPPAAFRKQRRGGRAGLACGCWRVTLRTVGCSRGWWQALSCCLSPAGPHPPVPRASSRADGGFHWIVLQEQLMLLPWDHQTQRRGEHWVKWDHPLRYLPPSRGQGAV